MIILSIETSCDESALSIMRATGTMKKPKFNIMADNVASQIKIHAEYGGVFPALAKREHGKALTPLFIKTLNDGGLFKEANKEWDSKTKKKIEEALSREPELLIDFLREFKKIKKPKIDLIAVTTGPGLEPALWVGISFAKALSILWDIPVIPVNHMEGHVISPLLLSNIEKREDEKTINVSFPALALLISGGHTELVLVKDWQKYKKIGQTRDDAVGEAFDKVARLLGLPYPGGPQISRLAEEARKNENSKRTIELPRPMIHSKDFDFSFSGLKTAVLYTIQKIPKMTEKIKVEIAREFEDSVTEVLVKKTMSAVLKHNVSTILVGGGVAANKNIKKNLEDAVLKYEREQKTNLIIHFPRTDLSTDNSLMIGLAGYFQFLKKKKGIPLSRLKADGNWELK